MKTVLHRAEERGRGEHGWLTTRYSFSFSDWHEPSRMGFGALRVINDDAIAPASGFGAHGHRDMEIITIVTAGAVTHTDSMGNKGAVRAGEVQVMSAGTGVVHAEKNDSPTEPLTLFQVWIEPKERGIAPRYAQKAFDFERRGATLLAAPEAAEGALAINQDAYITYANLAVGEALNYQLRRAGNGAYVFVIDGAVEAAGQVLGPRDALGISEAGAVGITAAKPSRLLLFDVPML